MNFHSRKTDEVLTELSADLNLGLTKAEADARIAKYGENKLAEGKKKTMLQRFFEQFKDVMIVILLIAAAIS